ncbi:hypothetical protein P3102_10550 [Amycolatopsis sp. QT-25]|uniref:hypothetical protein n=1 Tax=Amycolatopsis sp. QT-25 TaxID=3034022 RepID=UPI0023EABD89|nr:hypothetical protein [Amycolatopsis sp. QT-25]WET81614.1 hypothetical protein P3102_10550 [Amycolatopsis sp. QT-25]
MWSAPTTTAALLTHVVRGAEEAGYNGLMVALTRNADASAQLNELSEEWTSVHDVTGQLIAVLSPDPEVRTAKIRYPIVYECAAMHDLRLVPPEDHDFGFNRCFVGSVHGDQLRGRAEAVPPRPPQEHRNAWTEAASRCASYFGITEAQIPAVLLLSFAERTAVLIRLRPRSADSLYDLCKQVAADLGWTKRAAELSARQRALRQRQHHLHRVVDRPELSRAKWRSRSADRLGSRMTDELRAQYDGLDRHLSSIAEVNPALVQQWRARLAELRSHGTVEETYRQLFAIRRHVIAPQDRQKWRRLAAKVGKVIAATDRVILGRYTQFWNLDDADPITAELRRQEAEMGRQGAEMDRTATEARQELRQIDDELNSVAAELGDIKPKHDSEPGLAAATEAAARHMLGQIDTDTVDGSAGLAGYTVRVVRPMAEAPVEHIDNSLSGTVFGPMVQAGHIAGGVHIHQHGLWARMRRWFS